MSCDVVWCFVRCCLVCVCVFQFYHVKDVFVCVGDSLCDAANRVLCVLCVWYCLAWLIVCVIVVFVLCFCVSVCCL